MRTVSEIELDGVEAASGVGGRIHSELRACGDASVVRTSAEASTLATGLVPELVAAETAPTGSVEKQPPPGTTAAAAPPPAAGKQSNADGGVSDDLVPSFLVGYEIPFDSAALMHVSLEDDMSDNLFGSALCAPKLESGTVPRVIALSTRCAARARPQLEIWFPGCGRLQLKRARRTRTGTLVRSQDCYRF